MALNDYMPLNGALLISNPRSTPVMANVFDNPNYYRRANRQSRSSESQGRAASRKKLREDFRGQFGDNWSSNSSARAAYESKASALGISAKDLVRHVTSGEAKPTSKARKQQLRKSQQAYKKSIGASTRGKTKAGAFKWAKKRMVQTLKGGRKIIVADNTRVRAYNEARTGRRLSAADFDKASRKWGHPGAAGKAAGMLLAEIKAGTHRALYPHSEFPVPFSSYLTKADRRSKAKKAARTRKGKGIVAFGGKAKRYPKGTVPPQFKARLALVAAAKAAGVKGAGKMKNAELQAVVGRSNPSAIARYRDAHGLGALALDNEGVFGGLALTNGPFDGGVAVEAAKLIGTGLAGAAVHAMIAPTLEEYLPKIPVVGEMILSLSIPEAVPVIGGMRLTNTVTGALAGIAVIVASQYAGSKFGIRQLSTYGSILGGGIIVAGPVLDYANRGSGGMAGISAEELAGLALENDGVGDVSGLALENYGDGMAYELGPISGGDEYAQASLGDAYYSGADFDLDEGRQIVKGRGHFQQKYGAPTHRIEQYGGRTGGASHLAGQPGHRWGWLVKMIGWANVEKLAKMAPTQRVAILKQLRESALASFKQLTQESSVAALAPGEFGPIQSAEGAEGVSGAHSSFGSLIFGGKGL